LLQLRRVLLGDSLLLVKALAIYHHALLLLADELLLTFWRITRLLSGGHIAIAPPDLLSFVPTWRTDLGLCLRHLYRLLMLVRPLFRFHRLLMLFRLLLILVLPLLARLLFLLNLLFLLCVLLLSALLLLLRLSSGCGSLFLLPVLISPLGLLVLLFRLPLLFFLLPLRVGNGAADKARKQHYAADQST
jgi:hypothetical protein